MFMIINMHASSVCKGYLPYYPTSLKSSDDLYSDILQVIRIYVLTPPLPTTTTSAVAWHPMATPQQRHMATPQPVYAATPQPMYAAPPTHYHTLTHPPQYTYIHPVSRVPEERVSLRTCTSVCHHPSLTCTAYQYCNYNVTGASLFTLALPLVHQLVCHSKRICCSLDYLRSERLFRFHFEAIFTVSVSDFASEILPVMTPAVLNSDCSSAQTYSLDILLSLPLPSPPPPPPPPGPAGMGPGPHLPAPTHPHLHTALPPTLRPRLGSTRLSSRQHSCIRAVDDGPFPHRPPSSWPSLSYPRENSSKAGSLHLTFL